MTVITYLSHIRFDFGALAALPEDLAALEVRRPLIVSDEGLAATGLLDRLRALLPDAPVFTGTPSNPTEDAVEAALAVYRAEHCDGLVAFGGGSPIDLAKGVALLATHAGDLEPYAAILGGIARIGPVAPLIAIPTTAGTGSEVGRAALITLRDGRKLGFISPHLIPKRAICDPDLLVGMPPRLTAATGMDALSHCIETYLSPRVNPPAEAIALDGAARLVPAIRKAVADPTDRQARWETMMGALEGGLTFQKGLGAVHGLSHALGGLKSPSLHHGLLNAVLLPPVICHNAEAAPEKIARLAAVMGMDDLADGLAALNGEIGLPTSLAGMGLDAAIVPTMAERAMADHSTATNPRPMTAEAYAELLRAVL
jgi:alcohol dehydrogenase class IV